MSHKLHVTIPDGQYRALTELSAESGASIGELVRRALARAYAGQSSRERRLAAFDGGFGAWSDRPPGTDAQSEARELRPRIVEW